MHIKVGSHCRSDQLDHPDHGNFPTKPDQARLKRVYTTSSRPLVDTTRPPHDSFTTSTQPIPISARSTRPIRESYTISARPSGPQLDRHQIFTRPDRDGRTSVVQSRERPCIETLRIKTSKIVVH
ncbi:hypothetical protein DPMN_093596 [Dreissena polymorpha]|uniref:Uncharacterized protein n=1 Tax=Dreissena polymorpha TaxID=45954 RepID=A0A9D4R2P8_DREPO|nr:hypothetical protein DPMN_093596 [Dreissena polymorpha]